MTSSSLSFWPCVKHRQRGETLPAQNQQAARALAQIAYRGDQPSADLTAIGNFRLISAGDDGRAFSGQDVSRTRQLGRSSGFRIDLLATPSHGSPRRPRFSPGCRPQWSCSVRPRSQRRDRNGITPFSLFSGPNNKFKPAPMSRRDHIARAKAVKRRGKGAEPWVFRTRDGSGQGPMTKLKYSQSECFRFRLV